MRKGRLLKQAQANGKVFDENAAKERHIERFIENNIGARYAGEFDENLILQKEQIDSLVSDMLKKGTGIVLSGNVGVGKTMDLVYIVKRIVKGQKNYEEALVPDIPVAYYFMPDLFRRFHYGEYVALRKYVVLDDWGREYAEPFALSQFETFIEKVYSKKSILVITTNLTKEQFLKREGWLRITDRVRETCAFLEIKGKSRRHR